MFTLRKVQHNLRQHYPTGDRIPDELGGSVEREWTVVRQLGPFNQASVRKLLSDLIAAGADVCLKSVLPLSDTCGWNKAQLRCRQHHRDRPMDGFEIKVQHSSEEQTVGNVARSTSVSVELPLSDTEGLSIWTLAASTDVGKLKGERERIIVKNWNKKHPDMRIVISPTAVCLHYEIEEDDVCRRVSFDRKDAPWAEMTEAIDEAYEMIQPRIDSNKCPAKHKLRHFLPLSTDS